jgi:hypothetical protein
MMQHEIVTRDEWVAARRALLAKEKAMTRARDELSAERRELPWVRIDKQYFFDGPEGRLSLSDLFQGRSQLFIKHFMMGPGQVHHCVGCSFELDNADSVIVHLENHDVSYVAVARAPLAEIDVLKRRMGWRARFVSSFESDFNYDFNVSYTPEQLVVVARNTLGLGDPLVFDRRLQHRVRFPSGRHSCALDFLPRRLALGINVAAGRHRALPGATRSPRSLIRMSALSLVQIDPHLVARLQDREATAGGRFRRGVQDRG